MTTLNPHQDRQSYKMVKPCKSLKETLVRHDVKWVVIVATVDQGRSTALRP